MGKRQNYKQMQDKAVQAILDHTPVNPQYIVHLDIPDGKRHIWQVDTFTVSQEESKTDKLRALISYYGHKYERPLRYVDPGTYKRLSCRDEVIMSNTPNEVADHMPLIEAVEANPSTEQRILLNGLGLGLVVEMLHKTGKVKHVTVNELSQYVIELVEPHYKRKYGEWLQVNHSDAFGFKPPSGLKYDAVWHDIWSDITSDNLKDMKKLHAHYSRYALWQDSWCHDTCIFLSRYRSYYYR